MFLCPYAFFTADSQTGEEQSLRKVDETLIVDFNFLTVLRFLQLFTKNQHSKFHLPENFGKNHQLCNRQ